MAIASTQWVGGTTAIQTQVDTLTVGGVIEVGDEFNTIVTDEGGATLSVQTIATTTSVTTTRDEILADVQGETDERFTDITWASSGADAITATSTVAGKPFYLTVTTTESGGGAADLQTYTRANSTPNSGPNDWGVAGNWSNGVPSTGDNVHIPDGSQDILYGLDQSGVSLKSLTFGPQYTASVGSLTNDFYLSIDVDNTDSGNVPLLSFNARNQWMLLNVTAPNVSIIGTLDSTDAIKLDGTITNLRITDTNVIGGIHLADAMDVTNIYCIGADGASLNIGENVTSLALLEFSAGNIKCESACTTIKGSGGRLVHTSGAVSAIENRGAEIQYNGNGVLTDVDTYSGITDLSNSTADSVTVTNCRVWGGRFRERSGMKNVTYTNDIIRYGGEVEADSVQTIRFV